MREPECEACPLVIHDVVSCSKLRVFLCHVQGLAVACVSSTETRPSTSSLSTPLLGMEAVTSLFPIMTSSNLGTITSFFCVYRRAERQAAASGAISRVNKLVSSYSEGEGPELTQAVQELCQQSDALILVVNSSRMEGEGEREGLHLRYQIKEHSVNSHLKSCMKHFTEKALYPKVQKHSCRDALSQKQRKQCVHRLPTHHSPMQYRVATNHSAMHILSKEL